MSFNLRYKIAEKLIRAVKADTSSLTLLADISSKFQLRRNGFEHELHFPVNQANKILQSHNLEEIIKRIDDNKNKEYIIKNVLIKRNANDATIAFQLENDIFLNDVLHNTNKITNLQVEKKKILIEFSSPNIAKPFHVGHLRSTIIGNFIANLYKYLGHNVIRINYLGDWGTQIGFLRVGLDMINLKSIELETSPLSSLYQAYVKANQAAELDPLIADKARQKFQELEIEMSSNDLKLWNNLRNVTVKELNNIYKRIGIEFDEYNWESQYRKSNIKNLLESCEKKGLLITGKDGRKTIKAINRDIPIVKSDGTCLYLARDLAAIIDRNENYKFDKIIYVVDNAQTDHFKALFQIVNDYDKNMNINKMMHIKFGRIKGMSTRKGTVVFLNDVLNEAQSIMKEKQIQSPTTKINLTNLNDTCADTLGISAVIINDLKQRRQRDYDFDWEKILQVNGDTGIKLQYTHCRLCNLLEQNVDIEPANIAKSDLLAENEAIELITILASFHDVLLKSEKELEACILVNFAFSLCKVISRALKKLNVKHEKSKELQQQRILLFKCAKEILNLTMRILGLRPLEKM